MTDSSMHHTIRKICSGSYQSFFLIAGPCAVESRDMCFAVAECLQALTTRLGIPWVFKASVRKENRTRHDSFTGIGDAKALEVLSEVRSHFDVAITTDIHESSHVSEFAEVADVLQIPAFLSRQSTLISTAALTGRVVNIKKGPFMDAATAVHAAQKVVSTGNDRVWLTERGNSFGYQDLIVDYRNLSRMKRSGYPVIFDCTHTCQRPNQSSGITGGAASEESEILARAALAAGADGLFFETHPDPSAARSDSASMISLDLLDEILPRLVSLKKAINEIDEEIA